MAVGDYTVKLVEQDGTVLRTLVNANVISVTDELNGIGTARFSLPKIDPSGASGQAADARALLDHEAQIFRDNGTSPQLIWWGPMVMADASADSADVSVDVPGLGWYLTRRQISDARENRIGNGSFEAGLTGWTASGVTATADSTRAALGASALKLVQASVNVDTFVYQQQAFTAGALGSLFTVAAWVYVQNTGYVGPAMESRGLFVSGIEASVVRDYRFVEIDDATPRDRWHRLETTIWIPPGETWTLEVRLYAPGGTCWWDAVRLVKMESLSRYATDIGAIAGDLVDFIQNPVHGWDDLGITTSDATTGVLIDRHYQYADHTDAWQALGELVEMGLDWSFVVTTTTKVFTTYYPKGTDRSATVTLSMRNGGSGNLSDYRLTVDGSQTTTRVTVLGEGDGPDREEGYAADAFELGGLVLGEVVSAPSLAPISALSTIAANRLEKSKRLARVLEVSGIPNDATQHGTLVVGDTVDVSISDGWVAVTGDWRIVRKSVDCVTDTVSFVLNETAASYVFSFDGDDVSPAVTEDLDGGAASSGLVSVVDGGDA